MTVPESRLAGSGVLLVMAWLCMAPAAPADATLAPDFELDSSDGRNVSFHTDNAGRPAVLLFWASWCPYCRALFPHLEAVRKAFADRAVDFYALNVWEDGDPEAYFAQHGYGMTLLPAADLVAEDYGVQGTPAVYVTDGAQRILYTRRRGEEPEAVAAAVSGALDQALAATAGGAH